MLADLAMKVYILDTTLPDMGIPTAIVLITGAVFLPEELAARTPALSLAFDAAAGEREAQSMYLERARNNGPATRVLADQAEVHTLLRSGDAETAQNRLAALGDPPAGLLPPFDHDELMRTRLAWRGLFCLRAGDETGALTSLAQLTADRPQYSLDYLAGTAAAFDPAVWAAAERIHGRLRLLLTLRESTDAGQLVSAYEESTRGEADVIALLKSADDDLSAGRAPEARDAVERARTANQLAFELNFGYLLAARVSLKLGERGRALDELGRVRRLAPHDERVRTLLELLAAQPAATETA
jgi:hypothetical protein